MKRILFWLIVNLTIVISLVLGFIFDISGARNISIFVIWTLSIITIIGHRELKRIIQSNHKKTLMAFTPFSIGLDTGVVLFLIWYGRWITATLFLIHLFVIIGVKYNFKKVVDIE